jgi:hypothetical protein
MPILENCAVYFVRCNKDFPSKTFNEENPTWEVQIRTTDKKQKKEWEDLNLAVKSVIPDEGDPFWRVSLRKKSLKKDKNTGDMVPTMPPACVDGNLDPVDPDTIGHGSIANVEIFQYEYTKKGSTEKAVGTVLRGMQVTTHVVYKPKPFTPGPAFAKTETTRIMPKAETAESNDSEDITEDDVAF